MMDEYPDMNNEWQEVIDWVDRQIDKYGGEVHEGQIRYDWGQALNRQAFGKDWKNEYDKTTPQYPEPEVLAIVRKKTKFEWITNVKKSIYWVTTEVWCE